MRKCQTFTTFMADFNWIATTQQNTLNINDINTFSLISQFLFRVLLDWQKIWQMLSFLIFN